MIRSIVDWSHRFRLLVLGAAVAVTVYGVTQLPSASVDVLPEFTPPYVEIQTEALGLSASEVEQFITVPMEANLLSGVAWVDTIRSESLPGLSSIVLIFEPGTDPMRARQMVQERLGQVHGNVPNVSKPPVMIQPLSAASRVMMVSLSSDERSLIEMSVLARWTVRPRLMGVPGVANVAIWGQRERQLQVLVDPQRLSAAGVTLEQVIRTTGNALWVSPLSFLNASTPGTGGFIDTPNQRLGIRHVLPIRTAEHLAQVPVEGASVSLGQVAEVVEDHQPLIGDAHTDEHAALLLVVEKLPDANALQVTRDLETALAAMQPGLPGIEIDPTIYRPATFIEAAIRNVGASLLVGLGLLILVVAALLLQWHTAAIALVAIPVSLLTAMAVLHALGVTVNTMVVAGLVVAIGVVVDDAIASAETISRRLRREHQVPSGRSATEVIADATVELRTPLVYGTLIAVLAAAPLLVLGGEPGTLVRPMLLAYGLALLAASVVALTVTPALAFTLLRRPPRERREGRLIRSLQPGYHQGLLRVLRHPRPVLTAAIFIAVVGLAGLPLLNHAVLPTFRESDLLIDVAAAPGTSRPEMTRITAAVSRELRGVDGVRSVGAHVGRAIMSDAVVGIDSGQLWVNLEPSANYDATLAAVRDVIAGYPGLRLELDTYLNRTADEVTTSARNEIAVAVFGPDAGVLSSEAERVRSAIADVAGVTDARVELPVDEAAIDVEVDLAAAQQHGVKPGDVRRAAATLLSGIEVGNLFEDQKVFEVVVWGVPELRQSLSSVRNLLIDTPDSGQIRLSEVADVRVSATPRSIARENISRYLDVVATVEGRDVGAVRADIEDRLAGLDFPLEYHPEIQSLQDEQQTAFQLLLGVAAVAGVGIFLLLQAAFGSWRLATLAFLALPVALVGGVIAAFIGGGVLSLGSVLGFLTVLAIAARGEVALIRLYQRMEEAGVPFGPGLVLHGARDRLGTTVMTVLGTAAIFAPFLVLGERPGLELLRPTAIVVLGGLVTTLVLHLFLLPTIYLRLRSGPQPLEVDQPIPIAAGPQVAGAM